MQALWKPPFVILVSLLLFLVWPEAVMAAPPDEGEPTLVLRKTIRGDIRPKSVVHSGTGRFFAQNMMYRHHITVYDRNYNLVGTISDKVHLSDYGMTGFVGAYQGAPVEAAFSPDGSYAWISNYHMSGNGFDRP
ncbi:MAG: peptidoglycan-binding protein, partial [Bacteroidetes bacterium]